MFQTMKAMSLMHDRMKRGKPVVNFTNMFTSSFFADIIVPKITKLNSNKRKAAQNTLVQKKTFVKC